MSGFSGIIISNKLIFTTDLNTSVTNSLCQFLVSTIRALRRTSGIFISANFQYFFILKNSREVGKNLYHLVFHVEKIPEKRRNPRKSAMLWFLDVHLGLTVTLLLIYS
jgi:hypothetical protein